MIILYFLFQFFNNLCQFINLLFQFINFLFQFVNLLLFCQLYFFIKLQYKLKINLSAQSMTSYVSQLLKQLKGSILSSSDYHNITETARKQSLRIIELWRFKSQIRTLFKMAKFQSYMMLGFGFTVIPYILYTKYQQDKQKVTRIAIYAPIALGICVTPFVMYQKFSKKLIQAIAFNIQTKKFILTRFKDGHVIQTQIKHISYIKTDKGRVKELICNSNKKIGKDLQDPINKYQIQSLGQWQSIELFYFLTSQSNKQSL